MNKYDLSILIPARNEMFLAKTVEDVLQNIRGNTEIIVVLDGEWSDPGVPDDPRVTTIYLSSSIGQRAATNLACRASKAKYVMKLDAHCALSEGFDVKLMEVMQDDWTIVPVMRNLHVFDWVCKDCGYRQYQGRTPEKCPKCGDGVHGSSMERELIWHAKESPQSTSFRFDKTLHFQYFNEFKKRPEGQGNLTETMSLQGSCFMLTRDKYWELNISDEKAAGKTGWGQQGTEVACKTWLSGGKCMVLHTVWYAHMFRTQGGDFSFPFPLSGAEVDKTRKFSQDLWLNDKWEKQIHPLSWLVDRFKPVPGWHTPDPNSHRKLTKGVIYYTHNVGDPVILEACRKQLALGMKEKHIISASSEPLKFGKQNIVLSIKEPKFLDMFEKILAALKAHDADIIFFAEHDVLYHPKHFDFMPSKKDVYYYNTNIWRVRYSDGHALFCDDLQQLSGLVAYRETLIKHFEERVRRIKELGVFSPITAMGFEPGTHGRPERIDDLKAESYFADYPNIDIRHDDNSTASRWKKEQFRNERYTKGWEEGTLFGINGWDTSNDNVKEFLQSIISS